MDPNPRAEWEVIGEAFSETRPTPWPPVVEWLEGLPSGGRVLDLGAGNGRHGLAAEALGHTAVAVDFATSLAGIAHARGLRTVVADARAIPLGARTFDAALYVASLHHVRSREGRQGALREVARVLRSGAPALVTVWYRGEEEGGVDAVVPWNAGPQSVDRYYHFYRQGELAEDLEAAGFRVDRLEDVRLGAGARSRNLWAEVRAR